MVKPVTRFDVLDALGLAAMAKEHGGEVVLSQRVAEELARTWLAVDGAPAGVGKEVGGSMVVIGGLSEPFRASAKPVKLVLVPEAGGGEG